MQAKRLSLPVVLSCLAGLIIAGCTSRSAPTRFERRVHRHRTMARPFSAPAADMGFQAPPPSQYAYTGDDKRSTFAVDVDTASFELVRRMLNEGRPIPPEAVRTEEFVNAQAYGYRSPSSGELAIHTELCPAPFRDGMHLLRVGIQARRVHPADRKPANLVLVIDTSGSMADDDKLGLVKAACRALLAELDHNDRVAVVAYDTEATPVVPFVRAGEREAILHAVDRLRPGGRTSVEAGLEAGYGLASEQFDDDRTNRVILFSDGVANEDSLRADWILSAARRWAAEGIALTSVGVGFGEYNDHLLEQLADQGDGSYCYIDSPAEAERLLGRDFVRLGQVAAADVRVQVRFDSAAVRRYRLMGYDNRALDDDEFTSRHADGGEIGVGQSVTALYAVELRDAAAARPDATVATVHLRYDKPGALLTRKLKSRVRLADATSAFTDATDATRLAVAAAYFAELLRDTYWSGSYRLADIHAICRQTDLGSRGRAGRDRLLAMIDAARRAMPAADGPRRSRAEADDDGWVDASR